MSLELNDQFKQALAKADSNQNLFITGRAGTGKSTFLEYFCAHTQKKVVVLAPTGVAALNVKGQTIHRFFNFYIDVTPQKIRDKKVRPKDPALFKKLETIIIDEVSMARADLLDCVDTFLRLYGPVPNQPFGGIQMIFIGDLYQLPPVVMENEAEIFATYYQTPYFFSAPAFQEFSVEIVELEKIYRQKDQTFVELLNRVRNNLVGDADIISLNSRFQPEFKPADDQFYIYLTTTNKKADEINHTHLQALDGEMHQSTAVIKGEFGKEYFPTSTILQFKIGAQIMLLNNDLKKRWVNGSMGVIEAIKKDEDGEPYLHVRLQDNDRTVKVYRFEWEVYRFSFDGQTLLSEAVGTFTQYPFRLAWAITIHKSQGKTFEKVIVDIGAGTFATGQIYVALSRCTSFEGIILKTPIRKNHIRTDLRISSFLSNQSLKFSNAHK
jgi:ATP-dependent DNA helicase PIF1